MKDSPIIFTGKWAKELIPLISDYKDISYYVYMKGVDGFSLWTWNLETILQRYKLKKIINHEITEDEYYKIITLVSLGNEVRDSFIIVYNLGE